MKTIELSQHEVDIKDEITWYELEEAKATMQSGAKMNNEGLSGFDGHALLQAKLKLFEFFIEEIRDKDTDEKVKYSDKWVKGLSGSDGKKLDEAIDGFEKKV